MTALVLYDDARARRFAPFALSRPVGELRAGGALIRERWEWVVGSHAAGFLGARHLAHFEEPNAPPAVGEGTLAAGTVIANARFAPSLGAAPEGDVWRGGHGRAGEDRVVAVRLRTSVPVERFASGDLSLEDIASEQHAGASAPTLAGWWIAEVWDLIGCLTDMLRADIPAITATIDAHGAHGATVIGDAGDVVIEAGATVEPLVVFDVSNGPILVRAGASVASFTRLNGPCVVGVGTQVLGGRVGSSSFGEYCRVHGEVSSTIFVGHANKGHDGFVGHTVLGRWANLGASTVTSNLKNTYGAVQLWTPDGVRDTGLQFLGTLVGDHAKTGIGTRLTTGCVVGCGANVVTAGVSPKMIPPFAWGDGDQVYDIERFLRVAERAMKRRAVTLGDGGRRLLRAAYASRDESAA